MATYRLIIFSSWLKWSNLWRFLFGLGSLWAFDVRTAVIGLRLFVFNVAKELRLEAIMGTLWGTKADFAWTAGLGLTIGRVVDIDTPVGLTGVADPWVMAFEMGIKLIVVGVDPDLIVASCWGVALIICTFLSVDPFGIIFALISFRDELSTILKVAIKIQQCFWPNNDPPNQSIVYWQIWRSRIQLFICCRLL